MLCVTVFLSYLPEAGEYSSFFVYLRLVIDTVRLCQTACNSRILECSSTGLNKLNLLESVTLNPCDKDLTL